MSYMGFKYSKTITHVLYNKLYTTRCEYIHVLYYDIHLSNLYSKTNNKGLHMLKLASNKNIHLMFHVFFVLIIFNINLIMKKYYKIQKKLMHNRSLYFRLNMFGKEYLLIYYFFYFGKRQMKKLHAFYFFLSKLFFIK